MSFLITPCEYPVLNTIGLKNACIRFNDSFSLIDIDWTLEPGQVWAIIGASGSGKSALAASLTGAGELISGTINGVVANAGVVSLAYIRSMNPGESVKYELVLSSNQPQTFDLNLQVRSLRMPNGFTKTVKTDVIP